MIVRGAEAIVASALDGEAHPRRPAGRPSERRQATMMGMRPSGERAARIRGGEGEAAKR